MADTRQLEFAVRLPNGSICSRRTADPLAPSVTIDDLNKAIADMVAAIGRDYGVTDYQPELVYRWEVTTRTDWTPGLPDEDTAAAVDE